MHSLLPFLIAIGFAAVGAMLPEAYLPWLVLVTIVLMMTALWLFPPDARNHTLTCPVCGFRKRVKAPPKSCPILHDCPYCGSHSVPHPDDPCAVVMSPPRKLHRPGRD
ncbi:MAG TPA: hypothetical protein VFJ62_12090 [Usitatibacter sp.]|nr:hypothetical protein [Usitatibacter sp.]